MEHYIVSWGRAGHHAAARKEVSTHAPGGLPGKVFSVAYFLCFAVSVFAFAAYKGPYQIAGPLQNFALVFCQLALGIELSTLVFAAIFMPDYKKAIYAAVVFRRHRPPS